MYQQKTPFPLGRNDPKGDSAQTPPADRSQFQDGSCILTPIFSRSSFAFSFSLSFFFPPSHPNPLRLFSFAPSPPVPALFPLPILSPAYAGWGGAQPCAWPRPPCACDGGTACCCPWPAGDCILRDDGSVDAGGGWRGDTVDDLRDLNIVALCIICYRTLWPASRS